MFRKYRFVVILNQEIQEIQEKPLTFTKTSVKAISSPKFMHDVEATN